MKPSASKRFTLGAVTLFAIAFAWVESAVVLYLRTLVDRIEPYQPQPLPLVEGIIWVELIREAATMIMLATVGIVAGRNLVSRLGYALVAFGVWDIFYYVFLVPMTSWPNSLFDWDILFLLPLPWWGPVLAPMLIAALMISWGTLVTQFERLQRVALSDWRPLALNAVGVLLALVVFMSDGLHALARGDNALREILPTTFNWPLFVVALLLMSAPVVQLLVALWSSRTRQVRHHTQSAARQRAT